MTPTSDLKPTGERTRMAVRWISDTLQAYPEKTREETVKEATIRFDLTPLECEYLTKTLKSSENCSKE